MIFVEKHHGPAALDEKTRFRARLLQFILLFTHRYDDENTWTTNDSLNETREQNRDRGHEMQSSQFSFIIPIDQRHEFPLPVEVLEENRLRLAYSLKVPDQWTEFGYGHPLPWPSLHDLLYIFMKLTAARVTIGEWQVLSGWMDLAAQWMLQAVIEEYLLRGASGDETFNTIFAFGCPGRQARPDESEAIRVMRTLFCKQTNPNEQTDEWSKTRQEAIDDVRVSPPHTGLPLQPTNVDRFF